MECFTDRKLYSVGDEITLRCVITNTTSFEKHVRWLPHFGPSLSLGSDVPLWWRKPREMPRFAVVNVRPPVRLERETRPPHGDIVLPPNTAVEFVHKRPAREPGSFRWILAYRQADYSFITPEIQKRIEQETVFSDPVEFEIVEGVSAEDGDRSQAQ
jgi:hypothetical protein